MDPQQPQPTRQQPHLAYIPPHPSQPPNRTANSTPVSSPGLFSPNNPRATMSFPSSQPVSEGTTPPAASNSPFLHPLQTHKVRETHTANLDRDYMTGRKLLNQYEVIEEIGRGQHGKVKLARNLNTAEYVAIKIIPRLSKHRRLGKVSAADPRQKTNREIAILKKIRHPNVVALLEVIDDPELRKIYMVLEHVERGEVVWRKKGLPHICNFERRRIEIEMNGGQISAGEEDWARSLERKAVAKNAKRTTAQAKYGPASFWSVELGAAEHESPTPYSAGPLPESDIPRATARSVSRSTSKAASRASTPHPSEIGNVPLSDDEYEDMETPGPLRSNPASSSALDGTMYGAYVEDPMVRGRSPSMPDSIISHMSSVDFGAQAHDPFADDFSYVPCFTIDQARSAFRDTVLGLEYLHYHGIIHRDIKPANLLWTKDFRVKISDFGVSYFGRPVRDGEASDTVLESEALDWDDDRELSKTVGTPAFFAPELCYTDLDREPPKLSEQIDVWSLGVTLYCLIFARIPFLAEEEFSMFRKIATEDVYIPRRRLRPVAPFTDPTKTSLYKRVNNEPYRNDDDLLYEDIDEGLIDLLENMLVKNPEKRIRLRDVKRHRWVTEGINNFVGWIDDTDPARKAAGKKIQVDDRDIGRAVVPLTFLERAKSAVKKAVEKVIHPRVERGESFTRARAASSATSSAGDSPSNMPSTPYPRDGRRRSLRGEGLRVDDYFATVTQHPSEHPLTQSVTASPYASPSGEVPGAEPAQSAVSEPQTRAPGSPADTGASALAGRHSMSQRSIPRQGHGRSVSHAFLGQTPGPHEARTLPATPLVDGPFDVAASTFRRTREVRSDLEDWSRARSLDRAGLIFTNPTKRAEAIVGINALSTANHVGSSKSARPLRSIDLGKQTDPPALSSPQFFSPLAVSAYHHALPKSDTDIHNKQRTTIELQERPATSHRVEDTPDGKTPEQRVYNMSTPDSFSRAQEQLFRKQRLEHEGRAKEESAAVDADVEAARIPCPPSPDDVLGTLRSRGNSSLLAMSASSLSLGEAVQTPLTSPSELANASFILSHPPPAKITTDPMLTFQSDPSLPALLSGASSVSADVEGDFLGNPGIVNRSTLIDTTDSLTPPAMSKEPPAGFPLEQQDLAEDWELSSLTPVEITERLAGSSATSSNATAQPVDDCEDSDSDDGLVMAKSKKAGHKDLSSPMGKSIIAKRRDTNTSIASTETAKKVNVQGD